MKHVGRLVSGNRAMSTDAYNLYQHLSSVTSIRSRHWTELDRTPLLVLNERINIDIKGIAPQSSIIAI